MAAADSYQAKPSASSFAAHAAVITLLASAWSGFFLHARTWLLTQLVSPGSSVQPRGTLQPPCLCLCLYFSSLASWASQPAS